MCDIIFIENQKRGKTYEEDLCRRSAVHGQRKGF